MLFIVVEIEPQYVAKFLVYDNIVLEMTVQLINSATRWKWLSGYVLSSIFALRWESFVPETPREVILKIYNSEGWFEGYVRGNSNGCLPCSHVSSTVLLSWHSVCFYTSYIPYDPNGHSCSGIMMVVTPFEVYLSSKSLLNSVIQNSYRGLFLTEGKASVSKPLLQSHH